MSSIGNDTAASIVTNDTNALINKANQIVLACRGTNCNTSPETRQAITQQLSTLSQSQAFHTMNILDVPHNSVIGRNIFNSYINLAAVVAATYNYQCDDNTVSGPSCVLQSTSVITAKNNLQSLLVEPASNNVINISAISILSVVAIIAGILFIIFLILGIAEHMMISKETEQVKSVKTAKIAEEDVKPAVPVDPFNTKEPINAQ